MRFVAATAVALALCGCQDAGNTGHATGATGAAIRSPAETEAAPAFPPQTRSLRLRRSIGVRQHPRGESPYFGTVARDIRVGFRGAVEGPDCESRWIEIEPRGWVCEKYLEASEKPPAGVELPKLRRDEVVPGTYGKVRSGTRSVVLGDDGASTEGRKFEGSVTVRKLAERDIEGQAYWKIDKDEWVAASSIREHRPSRHFGALLGEAHGISLPLVFAIDPKSPGRQVATFADVVGQRRGDPVPPRTAAPMLSDDGERLRIGEDQWIPRAHGRLVTKAPPPPDLRPGERWIDIDLDSQVLVAYEGTEAVFATLISSGKGDNATPTGTYRIWIKFAETTMTGGMAEDGSAYSVATVPWTQFYANDLALHTAYWHDLFGLPRSHGCINLAPRDARFLYFWSDPKLPLGWSMAHGDVRSPGSLVRIRSQDDPDPEPVGYAAKLRSLTPAVGSDSYLYRK